MKKILVIEDNPEVRENLEEILELSNYEVATAENGKIGVEQAISDKPDLILCDVMMPELDGFGVLHILSKKPATSDIPFIFLTAKAEKTDFRRGMNLGADDYITKPFDEEELLCRIKVSLRRQEMAKETQVNQATRFTIGDYNFDYNLQELCYKGDAHRLTEKENEVLRLLCLNQDQILRRDDAVEKIYGKRDYFLGRSFDVFVSRLRKILSKDSRIVIENVFKVGFILKVEG